MNAIEHLRNAKRRKSYSMHARFKEILHGLISIGEEVLN